MVESRLVRYVVPIVAVIVSSAAIAAERSGQGARAKPMLIPMPRSMVVSGGTCPTNAPVKAVHVDGICSEGYELLVTKGRIVMRYSDDAGLFYANATLSQLCDEAERGAIPCVEIKDSPAFRWRGVMLDEARHFMGKATVKRVLDLMSRYKFNVFHWHLTDNQSWTFEVPEYPKLVQKGTGRDFGEKVGPFYYTANDIRDILEYAKARHVTIVPEIDFPGHFGSVARAYPQFANGKKHMCIGNPEAVRFAEKVLDYVCELFPSSEIHIGGDECNVKDWEKCAKCKGLVEREGLGGIDGIQPWLTRHLASYLASKGRRAIGWEEIAVERGNAKLPPKGQVVVMGYHKEPAARAANMGYAVVSCPNWHCYFDFTQKLPEDPFNYFLLDKRWLPFEEVYRFDPFEGVEPRNRGKIIGGQCCNWTERTLNRHDLEWKMWPRALALAEVVWTNPDPKKRDFAEFSLRAEEHRRRLIRDHVNCAPLK